MVAKKIFITLENGQEVKVKWFDKATREEIEHSIRQASELPANARFQLLDDEDDVIVLSSSIPNNTKLSLKVIKAVKAAPSGKRKHSKTEAAAAEAPNSSKRLRSATRDGEGSPV